MEANRSLRFAIKEDPLMSEPIPGSPEWAIRQEHSLLTAATVSRVLRISRRAVDAARTTLSDYSSIIEQFGYCASVLELAQDDGTIMPSACDLAAIRA